MEAGMSHMRGPCIVTHFTMVGPQICLGASQQPKQKGEKPELSCTGPQGKGRGRLALEVQGEHSHALTDSRTRWYQQHPPR